MGIGRASVEISRTRHALFCRRICAADSPGAAGNGSRAEWSFTSCWRGIGVSRCRRRRRARSSSSWCGRIFWRCRDSRGFSPRSGCGTISRIGWTSAPGTTWALILWHSPWTANTGPCSASAMPPMPTSPRSPSTRSSRRRADGSPTIPSNPANSHVGSGFRRRTTGRRMPRPRCRTRCRR